MSRLHKYGSTVILGLVLSTMLSGTALAVDCVELEIDRITMVDGSLSPVIVGRSDGGSTSSFRVDLVGTYLNVQLGEIAEGEIQDERSADTFSVEIDRLSTVGATVCSDGSVQLETAPPIQPDPTDADELEAETPASPRETPEATPTASFDEAPSSTLDYSFRPREWR